MAQPSERSSHETADCCRGETAYSQGATSCSRGKTDWFLRRVGLARTTTFLCALGLSLAAATGPHPLAAVLALTTALCAVLAGVAIPSLARRSTSSPNRVVVVSILLAGLSMGFLGGSVRLMMIFDSELADHVDERIVAKLVISGPVRTTGGVRGGWQSAVAEIETARLVAAGKDDFSVESNLSSGGRVLLEVALAPVEDGEEATTSSALTEGAIVTCEGIVREPQGPTSGGYDQRFHLRRQGIEVVLAVKARDLAVEDSRGGFWGFFDGIRARARTDLSRGPSARIDEVLKGVVMGETGGIGDDWLESFRRAGTAHMFSVSGLHVASLAAIMLGLARLTRRSRATGNVMAALAACFMIPFTGGSPPVIRAVAMVIVVLMGRWVGRGRDHWQVLALAACVVLALNPLSLFDVGFQLSFGAFTGMLALAKPLHLRMGRLSPGVASNLSVSIAASLGTAPVSLLVFGRTSIIGALANLVVVPVLPVITGLGLGAVILGHVWGGFSAVLDWAVAPVVSWTVQTSRLFGAAPVLEVDDLGRAAAAAALALALAPLACALAGRVVRPPARMRLPWFHRSVSRIYRHRPRSHERGLLLAVVLLLAAMGSGAGIYTPAKGAFQAAAVAWGARTWPQNVEVRVLDVGQGNAVLVRTPGGRSLLFDGGPAGCELNDQLIALGVRRLDAVIISHPHADHFAGLLECIDEVRVDTLLDAVTVFAAQRGDGDEDQNVAYSQGALEAVRPPGSREAQEYLQLRRSVQEQGGEHVLVDSLSALEVDGLRVTFFAPRKPLEMTDGIDPWANRRAAPGGEELNGASLVALLEYGESEILLPGDAEAKTLERYDLPQADVILIPHHGSRGAFSVRLIELLDVRSAAISVGRDNSFGHPDPSTMELLLQTQLAVARTDLAGWICYTTDGSHLVMSSERDGDR